MQKFALIIAGLFAALTSGTVTAGLKRATEQEIANSNLQKRASELNPVSGPQGDILILIIPAEPADEDVGTPGTNGQKGIASESAEPKQTGNQGEDLNTKDTTESDNSDSEASDATPKAESEKTAVPADEQSDRVPKTDAHSDSTELTAPN